MEKIVSNQVIKEIKGYTFFNQDLIKTASKGPGDVYSSEEVAKAQVQWEISTGGPYLKYIKSLSTTWPHLRLLADFMEIGTTPLRWPAFVQGKRTQTEREERAIRTNVTRLDYRDSGRVLTETYTTHKALSIGLTQDSHPSDNDKSQLKLFVVEDLSREVIELLGANLEIEPSFFREQISDYAWYNIRDRWFEPPSLNLAAGRQRWLQLRFVTARYFKDAVSFKKGREEEADKFNVLRRPDDDQNNKALWDRSEAIVGITRSRASFWLKSTTDQKNGAVGVLLLDPTIKEGFPLWYGYRNWEATPGMSDKIPDGPPRDSLYNDFIYWAQNLDAFRTSPATIPASLSTVPASNIHVPIQALLHLVCAEWLTMADYIKTRLGQIEWEISYPEHFLNKGSNIDVALKKLHTWRRLVPLYREMLAETRQRVFNFPCHTMDLMIGGSDLGSAPNSSTSNSTSTSTNTGTNNHNCCQCSHHPAPANTGPINALSDDFTRVLSYMEEYQRRIDRLTSVVTAIISIEDSRRGRADNRNVARLTWLATFFIPLSFVASLFSMQDDLGKLTQSYKTYFAVALPLAAMSLGMALILALPSVQLLGTWTRSTLGISGEKKNV